MSPSLLHDELHLYPTAHALAGVWLACVVSYFAVRLLWLSFATQHKLKVERGDARVSPWALLFDTSPRWGWLSMRAGFHRRAMWKRVSRRSAYATLVVAAVMVGVNTTMLYLRTGSWVQQPYAWYSLHATGSRVFGKSLSLPSTILDTCLASAKVTPTDSVLLTMEDVLPTNDDEQVPKKPTVVHVVPYGWSGLVEVTSAQATAGNASYHGVLRQSEASESPAMIDYERVTPLDALTMFPYVWHSMLGASFSDAVTVVSPWERRVEGAQLTFQLVRSQAELERLEPGSNVFAIVQGMGNVLHLADSLPAGSKVGYIALSKEDCNNAHAESYTSHPAIRFGLFPYGDCSLVDNNRFSVVPLGPSFEHGYPINTHRTFIPPVSKRTHLLNLMVSWTVEKPTRIQAMMAALDVCGSSLANRRSCVIEHNDLAFKVLQKIDSVLGLDLRWALSSAPNAYVENLKQSVFTLCPFGKNPEQYRIWEALAAGSIPVIEDMPSPARDGDHSFQPGQFLHPSYPSTWKCRPDEDVHGFLKRKQAPVIFVKDWKRDLPRVVRHYTVDHPEKLVALQARAKQWYLNMGEHLQADLVAKSLRHFR